MKTLKKDLLIWVIVFGVLTIPFAIFDIDIWFQKPFYSNDAGWFMSQMPFWDFIYKYGIFLGYFLVVVALITLSVSYWKRSVVKWRRPAFFLLFVMIVGPGVFVNATLKDHWGHPRPREIKEFGGKEDYVKVWVKGPTNGKSFPCGHASMGFFMSIPFLFLRKMYKKWAWGFFFFGTAYGLLIGFARMVAGGHFASDVLWAAGVVWLTGIVSYYFLRTSKKLDISNYDDAKQKKKRRLATILVGIVLPVITLALLLATPYVSHREFTKTKDVLSEYNIQAFNVQFSEGIVNVNFGEDFIVDFKVNAFGFPNSKIGWKWEPGTQTNFKLTRMGWFTEVRNEVELLLPDNNILSNSILVEEGDIYITIPTDSVPRNLNLEVVTGNIHIQISEAASVNLSVDEKKLINSTNINVAQMNEGTMTLNASITEEGKVYLEYSE